MCWDRGKLVWSIPTAAIPESACNARNWKTHAYAPGRSRDDDDSVGRFGGHVYRSKLLAVNDVRCVKVEEVEERSADIR